MFWCCYRPPFVGLVVRRLDGKSRIASGCLVFAGGHRLAEQIALSRPLHKCSKLHSKYEARPELAATGRLFTALLTPQLTVVNFLRTFYIHL